MDEAWEPGGKHLFGTVKVGEKGQIVIPKQARDIFAIKPGDRLMVLGDEHTGLALMSAEIFWKIARQYAAAEALPEKERTERMEELQALAGRETEEE